MFVIERVSELSEVVCFLLSNFAPLLFAPLCDTPFESA